jgi:hypothetical protein
MIALFDTRTPFALSGLLASSRMKEQPMSDEKLRDLDVPPQLRSRPAKFISFNSSAVD